MSFRRLLPLVDLEGLKRLKAAHVLVVGCGGVGSYVVEALARSGVGTLTLVDPDTVEACNVNRQLMAFHTTVGAVKVAWLKDHVQTIDPDLAVHAHAIPYAQDTKEMLWETAYDFVVDAIDQRKEKVDLIEEALERNVPFVSVLGQGNRLGIGSIKVCRLDQTHTDPLARKLRHHFRNHPLKKQINVVFNAAQADVEPTGSGCVASSIFAPASAGLMAASAAVHHILGRDL
jgi:tRNA A37 threonylcarbamoyladenosine dehydratase